MTLAQYVTVNDGKVVKEPMGVTSLDGECVSLWKDEEMKVHSIPYIDLFVPDGRAKNIWKLTTPAMLKHYSKIPVTQSPQVGDTVVYDGVYGDVALYIGNGQVFGQLGTPVFKPAAKRPIGNPIGYLRLKGDDVITKDDINPLRVVMGEIEGFKAPDIYQGKNDKQIMDFWVGKTWQEAIMHGWQVQKTHRQALVDSANKAAPDTLTGGGLTYKKQ